MERGSELGGSTGCSTPAQENDAGAADERMFTASGAPAASPGAKRRSERQHARALAAGELPVAPAARLYIRTPIVERQTATKPYRAKIFIASKQVVMARTDDLLQAESVALPATATAVLMATTPSRKIARVPFTVSLHWSRSQAGRWRATTDIHFPLEDAASALFPKNCIVTHHLELKIQLGVTEVVCASSELSLNAGGVKPSSAHTHARLREPLSPSNVSWQDSADVASELGTSRMLPTEVGQVLMLLQATRPVDAPFATPIAAGRRRRSDTPTGRGVAEVDKKPRRDSVLSPAAVYLSRVPADAADQSPAWEHAGAQMVAQLSPRAVPYSTPAGGIAGFVPAAVASRTALAAPQASFGAGLHGDGHTPSVVAATDGI